MATLPELRAPRVVGDLVRPEITIKPRFDLAADLGVTTAALSQTIRIATLGDIAQNSAKFSLADRQVPITVALSENAAPRPGDAREPARADLERRLGAAEVGRRNRLRRRARPRSSAPTRSAASRSAPTSRPAWSSGDVVAEDQRSCRRSKNLPAGRAEARRSATRSGRRELIYYFLIALGSGVLLVFAVLVLLYRRFLSPLVNMGSLLLAPLGAAIALAHRPATRSRCRC